VRIVDVHLDYAALDRLAEAAITKGLRGVGLEAASLMQSSMRESVAAGERYGNHTASAPGQPPAIDTGRLVGSVFSTGVERIGGDLAVRVGTNTEYAIYLEQGTERMAARPFIAPAVLNNRQRLLSVFDRFAQ
jgi:HK97 gp10 family phage protein